MTGQPRELGRLFVYGSLRSDAPRERAGAKRAFAMLEAGAELEGRATIAGRLYAPSWYPGFAPGDGGQVTGEVWRILDPDLLVRLDAYEGDGYVREQREVVPVAGALDGLGVTAWVYRYVADIAGVSEIASRDYLGWVRNPG